MATTRHRRAESTPVSNETRGHAIKARRLAHGIKSARAFAQATKVDREAIARAEDGLGSEQTYERLEAWLDRFEEETGSDEPSDPQLVTFRLTGVYGVRDVVISGPVENIAELQTAVENLLRGAAGAEE